jgi:hypothetical protein
MCRCALIVATDRARPNCRITRAGGAPFQELRAPSICSAFQERVSHRSRVASNLWGPVKLQDGQLRLAATDVSKFTACVHATALDLAAQRRTRKPPAFFPDPAADLLRKRPTSPWTPSLPARRRRPRCCSSASTQSCYCTPRACFALAKPSPAETLVQELVEGLG